MAWGLDEVVSNVSGPAPAKLSELDTDGDGIPDRHDFCNREQKRSWLSGRATDFDGDGCEDGMEDPDKDNDGVKDEDDRCPFTPQKFHFVSNHASDFDGDGCADGLEDFDDDGDGTVNVIDRCPRTASGHNSDVTGCSAVQHDIKEEERKEELDRAQRQKPPPPQSWFELLKSAWVEVLLGGVLTSVSGQAIHVLGLLQQKARQHTPSPTGSVRRFSTKALHAASTRRFSWRSLVLRALVYLAFFCTVYTLRVTKAKYGVMQWG